MPNGPTSFAGITLPYFVLTPNRCLVSECPACWRMLREDLDQSNNRQGPGRVHAMGKRRLPLIRLLLFICRRFAGPGSACFVANIESALRFAQ